MVGNLFNIGDIKRTIEDRVQAIKTEISSKVDTLHRDNEELKKQINELQRQVQTLTNAINQMKK